METGGVWFVDGGTTVFNWLVDEVVQTESDTIFNTEKDAHFNLNDQKLCND